MKVVMPILKHGNGFVKGNLESFTYTAQKMKFSTKDFFSKCDQIRNLPILATWLTLNC